MEWVLPVFFSYRTHCLHCMMLSKIHGVCTVLVPCVDLDKIIPSHELCTFGLTRN